MISALSNTKTELSLDAGATISEGPTWDVAGGRLLWVDIPVGQVNELRLSGKDDWEAGRSWTLGRPVSAAVPRASGGLLLAAGIEILAMDEGGAITPFARIDADPQLVRFNDAKCDRQGRLWAGTQSYDGRAGDGAALYRIDPSGDVTRIVENLAIANGMGWSPDGSTFYFIDTPTMGVDAFDFDQKLGSLGNRRRIVTIAHGQGRPDGMTVDAEGCLWLALMYAGEVRRYSPDGSLLATLEVSAPETTSCGFGGPDLGDLFITTARFSMPDWRVSEAGFPPDFNERALTAPGAGGIFHCRPGVAGIPATPFCG